MADKITNRDDCIDSQDVIERLEELKDDLQGVYDSMCELMDTFREQHHDLLDASDSDWIETDFRKWVEQQDDCPEKVDLEALDAGLLDGKSFDAWVKWMEVEQLDDDAEEYVQLRDFAEEAKGYSPDWEYGSTLIRDSHFEDYARETAEDCGYIQRGVGWPYTCIDWARAAEELQQDYTSVELAGVTYWVR